MNVVRFVFRQFAIALLVTAVIFAFFEAVSLSVILFAEGYAAGVLLVAPVLWFALRNIWKYFPPYTGGFSHKADFWTGIVMGVLATNAVAYIFIEIAQFAEMNWIAISWATIVGGKGGLVVVWVKAHITAKAGKCEEALSAQAQAA